MIEARPSAHRATFVPEAWASTHETIPVTPARYEGRRRGNNPAKSYQRAFWRCHNTGELRPDENIGDKECKEGSTKTEANVSEDEETRSGVMREDPPRRSALRSHPKKTGVTTEITLPPVNVEDDCLIEDNGDTPMEERPINKDSRDVKPWTKTSVIDA